MIDLYRRNGGPPAALPDKAYTADGYSRTDLANQPATLAELGFVKFGSYDPATQAIVAQGDGFAVVPLASVDNPNDPFSNFIPIPLLRQRIEKLGMWDDFAGYLAQRPALFLKVLSLEVGVDPSYPALSDAFAEMDIPDAIRAYILAPPSVGAGDPPSMG